MPMFLEFLPLYLEMKYKKKTKKTKIHLFLRQFYFTKHSLMPNKQIKYMF